MNAIYLCREVSRTNGKITVFPVGMNLEDGEISSLMLRQKLHPELRYFVVVDREYYLHKYTIEDMLCREIIPSKEALAEFYVAAFPLI